MKENYKLVDSKKLLREYGSLLPLLSKCMKEYGFSDETRVVTALKDATVGLMHGFDKVNTHLHGPDCVKSSTGEELENKNVSFNSKSNTTNFEDTTMEKVEVLCSPNTTISVTKWNEEGEPIFIAYGKANENLKEELQKQVQSCKDKGVRLNPRVSIQDLFVKFGFKATSNVMSENDLKMYLAKNNFTRKGRKGKGKFQFGIGRPLMTDDDLSKKYANAIKWLNVGKTQRWVAKHCNISITTVNKLNKKFASGNM